LDLLRQATEAAGKTLAPRLTVYPEFVREPEPWLDPAVRFAVLCASDSEGLARDDSWAAGGDDAPPSLLPALAPPARAGSPGGEGGERRGADDPRARIHGTRGHRGGAPARDAAARLPRARERSRTLVAAGHRGRNPRRRGARGDLSRQGRYGRMAAGASPRAL